MIAVEDIIVGLAVWLLLAIPAGLALGQILHRMGGEADDGALACSRRRRAPRPPLSLHDDRWP